GELISESPARARRPRRHTLSGTIEGMPADQALEAVLRTFGLRHRIDGERLIVEAADELG
ncbi:MAG: hypothetical protein AAGE01_16210, partial [Pseudomonadota bacterium]